MNKMHESNRWLWNDQAPDGTTHAISGANDE